MYELAVNLPMRYQTLFSPTSGNKWNEKLGLGMRLPRTYKPHTGSLFPKLSGLLAEPKGEANNRDALSFSRGYVYPQRLRNTILSRMYIRLLAQQRLWPRLLLACLARFL